MAHDNARVGHEELELRAHHLDGRHAVVQEEHLAPALNLAPNRVADDAVVVVLHERLDGQAVLRRRRDGAHVPRAGEREIQRARDGRGREREHIHVGPHQLELLLVHHPEALLLINHHKAKVLERHVTLHEPVRADDNVHRARLQLLHDVQLLLLRAIAREQLDAHRVVRHAFAEGVVMLLRQHGRRHEDGHLLAAHHALERGADGHLRLAEAHVAAHEAVHGLGDFQVMLRLADGAKLVGRFLVEKGTFKLALPRRVRPKRMARLRGALGLNLEQVRRDIPHRALGLLLGLLPTFPTEGVQRRTQLARAHILADEMRLGDGDVELGRLAVGIGRGVFEDETLLAGSWGWGLGSGVWGGLAPRRGEHLQPLKSSDAVLEMHDVIAFFQLAEINVHRRARGNRVRGLHAPRPLHLVATKYLRVRHDHELRRLAEEPAREGAETDRGEGKLGIGNWELGMGGIGIRTGAVPRRAVFSLAPTGGEGWGEGAAGETLRWGNYQIS